MVKNKQKKQEENITGYREPLGFAGIFLKVIALVTSLYHLYISYFGVPYSLLHRPIHFLLVFIIMFMIYPSPKDKKGAAGKIPIYDWLLIMLTFFSAGYLIINYKTLMVRMPFVTEITILDYIFGSSTILLILIATYRVIGKSLLIITVFFLLYGYFGKYLPDPLWHRGYSIERIIEQMYLTLDGIWGLPLHVSSTFVYLFILLGTFLIVTGAGNFFTDLAFVLTRKSTGGSAKTAIVASLFLGLISGSSTANVVTTGSFTIPMMKKAGFSPVFAGAVESVASTGGQIVPPVMGATAFIMAEFTGIAYVNIMKHAIIPALLYYLGVFVMVHLEAVKLGMKIDLDLGEDTPKVKDILLSRGYLFIPIITIIYFLLQGYTPLRAALFAIFVLLFLEFLKHKDKREFMKMIPKGLIEAPRVMAIITIACSCAGIIVGIINLTGLGQRITSIIITFSGGSLPVTLVLTMIMAMVLGMGMPTAGAYVIMAALLAPAIIRMGVPVIAAHMYIFYFACLSAITPPVAMASYAAAAIAGASPSKTGYMGFRLGLAAYIVPYMFLYGPSLLLIGSFSKIILTVITAITGIFALGFAVQGWLYFRINLYQRTLLFISAILLIKPGLPTDLLGILILFVLAYYNFRCRKTNNHKLTNSQ